MTELLDEPQIEARLQEIPGWRIDGVALTREYLLKDFATALAFVNAVGALAEKANHHPDITINWNRVGLSLSTHSKGGLTALDFDLAASIEKLA